MNNYELLLTESYERWNRGEDLDNMLTYLKAQNLNIIESIKVVMAIKNVSLGEAKQLVHFSKTWQGERTLHESFHQAIHEELDTEEE